MKTETDILKQYETLKKDALALGLNIVILNQTKYTVGNDIAVIDIADNKEVQRYYGLDSLGLFLEGYGAAKQW